MAPPSDPGGSSDSTSINKDGKTFFEVLPRELRDRIYEYTFDHDISDDYYRYQFKAPLYHLRLVNRQFMHEYDEQTPNDTTLFVSACTNQFERIDSSLLHGLPRQAFKCTVADVALQIGETDGFARDLKDERYYVQESLFDHLSNIDLFI